MISGLFGECHHVEPALLSEVDLSASLPHCTFIILKFVVIHAHLTLLDGPKNTVQWSTLLFPLGDIIASISGIPSK